jgi:hypothetical protein
MERLRKIGHVKATTFNKQFDQVYDYWKRKAEDELDYYGDLRFIKEHNLVFIYTVIEIEDGEIIDPKNYNDIENTEED